MLKQTRVRCPSETHQRTEPVRVKAGIGLLPLFRVRAEEGGAQLAHELQLVRFHRPRSTRGMTHPGNGIAHTGVRRRGEIAFWLLTAITCGMLLETSTRPAFQKENSPTHTKNSEMVIVI